jgi:hypothetical protein
MARGLDDELRGTAFAIVDGIDGRVHHLKLPDIESASDGPIGGIVELRRFEDARGRQRIALVVRSDLNLDQQVAAEGATWLDRRLVARESAELSRAGKAAARRKVTVRLTRPCMKTRRQSGTVSVGRSEAMTEVTYYVAIPFVAADDGIAAGEPTECFNPNAAVMRAEALSRKEGHVGAVAFSRTGDPATGDFSDAKVIRKFGDA